MQGARSDRTDLLPNKLLILKRELFLRPSLMISCKSVTLPYTEPQRTGNEEEGLFMNHCKLIITSLSILSFAATASSQEATPEAVFETRLKPIFNSPDPSSCIQCHLAAVDLKNYILPTSRETFISLRDQGLVNTQHPDESKILHLISMGDSDPDILSQRIHAKNRKREYDAFSHWIKACCQNEDLLAAKPLEINKKAGPVLSNAVIRHARTDRVLDSFIRNVWSQRMRCFPCHTPAELDSGNPMHKKPIPTAP